MESPVVALVSVVTAAVKTQTGPHASVGSNIGPALPIILAVVVVGVAVYLVRQRRRRPPNGSA